MGSLNGVLLGKLIRFFLRIGTAHLRGLLLLAVRTHFRVKITLGLWHIRETWCCVTYFNEDKLAWPKVVYCFERALLSGLNCSRSLRAQNDWRVALPVWRPETSWKQLRKDGQVMASLRQVLTRNHVHWFRIDLKGWWPWKCNTISWHVSFDCRSVPFVV